MPEAIVNDLKAAGDEFMGVLSSFSQQQINISSNADCWTAAQVGDHLLKAHSFVLGVVCGKSEKSERAQDQKAPEIKRIFLDFSVKFKAAEAIVPSDDRLEKENLLAALKTKFEPLYEAASTLDLSETCLKSEFPFMGTLTSYEWFYFVCSHTERHIYQLKNILQRTAENKSLLSQTIS